MNRENIIFVSGANRGIGLEFFRQLLARDANVIGGYRKASRSQELIKAAERSENGHSCAVDVTDEADVERLRDFIERHFKRLDILINNAGVNIRYDDDLDSITPADLMDNFRANVVGSFRTAAALYPLLARSGTGRIINISSRMGSISESTGKATPYRISKAAVNMLTKNQSLEYKDGGVITVAMHPGWVQTDMGGPQAPLSPQESVAGMLKVIDDLTNNDNGAFLSFQGDVIPY